MYKCRSMAIMKNLNIIILIFVAIALNISKALLKDEMKAAASTCRKEFPNVKTDIDDIFHGKIREKYDDDEFKCLVKCMMERQGSFVNGTLQRTSLLKYAKKDPLFNDYPPELLETIEKCSLMKGANDCETAFKMIACLI
ncbi:general odorant-binding protein 56h [Stomoxys calcitrans]|uniref:Odorant binding protein n=1 Tax=Stomoxys calcitrans TaxID=35570 RepID=A0A1I8NPZ2_STOCA|nr:general odorant-binding protein 56h [Stomoxys calcitrans]